MYIPGHFQEKDINETIGLMREFGFATLVSSVNGLPWATHIPLELEIGEDGKWLLFGHMSKANPQWKALQNKADVLAIFMGPHSYISPSWYDHKNVPTWNYRAVHAYGNATLIEGKPLVDRLKQLMHRYESTHAKNPTSYDEVPDEILDGDLRGLVGFEMIISKIESVSKLSQNRNEASYDSIIENLKEMNVYDSMRIAEEMKKRKTRS